MPESLSRVQKLTSKTLTFYEVDLLNKEALKAVMSKVSLYSPISLMKVFNIFCTQLQHQIDCVMHFAALKAVGESCAQPLRYYGNNVSGSSNLLEVMMECGVKKIVFSSSATVYGDPEYLPLDEEHPTGRCTNPYGKTKFFMEEIMKDVCTANKVSLNLKSFRR